MARRPKTRLHASSKWTSAADMSITMRMFAEGHSITDIIKYLDDQKKAHPSASSVRQMMLAKKHQPEIEAYRDNYYAQIRDVPIAHKRTRLDAIQKVFTTLNKTFTKVVDKRTGTIKLKEFKNASTIIKSLESMMTRAQDEMERKPASMIMISQNFKNSNITTEELIVEERNIFGRIKELEAEGISFAGGTVQNSKRLEIAAS